MIQRGYLIRYFMLTLSLLFLVILVLIGAISHSDYAELLRSEIRSRALNVSRAVSNMSQVKRDIMVVEPNIVFSNIFHKMEDIGLSLSYVGYMGLDGGFFYNKVNESESVAPPSNYDFADVLNSMDEHVTLIRLRDHYVVRAYSQVYNTSGNRIGVIGIEMIDYGARNSEKEQILIIFYSIALGMLFGIIGLYLIGRKLKRTLLGYAPEQIVDVYTQRNAILEESRDGIIFVDNDFRVRIINSSAKTMLDIVDYDIVGADIREVFPEINLIYTLKDMRVEHDYMQRVGEKFFYVNKLPIRKNGRVIGALITLRGKNEMDDLARQLTGANMLVDALRANTHEFLNKLHVLLGFIDMKEWELASIFIRKITKSQQQLTSFIVNNINEPSLAALLMGKTHTGKELGIELIISDKSKLNKEECKGKENAFITIIGNLISNAFDSFKGHDKADKKVKLLLAYRYGEIIIYVKDNGSGIHKEYKDKIFERGFSTKDKGGGTGLYLVKQNVELLEGTIRFRTKVGVGSEFLIKIPVDL